MAKSIIKEIIIILLLSLAIILVLGILLYEYVPTNKTIPNSSSYTTPEEVKQELLASDEVDENQIVMTYEINSSDLNNYRRIQDYKPGKANPFSSYETTGSSTPSSGATGSGATSGTSNITTEGTSSGGTFFQNTGTK